MRSISISKFAWLALVATVTGARAAPAGPGLWDLPDTTRPAHEVEQDLSAVDEQLTAVLAGSGSDESSTESLGIGAGPERGSALINPDPARQPPMGSGMMQTIVALGGVVLLIFGLAWMFKRAARATGGLAGSVGAGGRAPAGLVEVLGRYPLAARHTLVVLRFDRRVLLCSMTGGSRSSGARMTTLCELDDAEDVASVLIKARDESGESIARSFERSLRDAEHHADSAHEPDPIRVRIPRTGVRVGDLTADGAGPMKRGLGSVLRGGGR